MSTEPTIYHIKKYPNRRFYDATRSRHVTLDELYELVRRGHSIQVTDSNSGDDITNVVLTQMILEREPPKLGLFPAGLLHQVIQANQQILHSFVERYFSHALDAFMQSQQQFGDFLRRAGVPDPGLAAPFQWARSFMPGGLGAAPQQQPVHADEGAEQPAASNGEQAALDELRRQVAALSAQLGELKHPARKRTAKSRPTAAPRKRAAPDEPR